MATPRYCRSCRGDRPFRVVAYERAAAIPPGHPVPEYRACGDCGLIVLALADVPDSEGLVATVVARARRRQSHAFGAQTFKYDPEEALGHLLFQLWRLYRTWRPAQLTFTSYASQWLPRRLDDWIGESSGSPTRGGRDENGKVKRRATVKHDTDPLDNARDVGVRDLFGFGAVAFDELIDELVVPGDDRLATLVRGVSADACDDRFRRLLRILPGADRGGDGGLRRKRLALAPASPS